MLRSTALALSLAFVASPSEAAEVSSTASAAIERVIAQSGPDLLALYRDLHAHPELSNEETRTSARLAEEMRKLGLSVTEKVGGTGIVAVLRNGDGPVVLIRADMDGLPMKELSDAPYASKQEASYRGSTTFVAHSCGHDLHMAWWVGTASALLATKDEWRGTVVFVGQPGEEGGAGARNMIEDGLFTRFPKPDFGFAAHVGNDPVGRIVVKQGAFTSNSDTIRITFKGKGGHGSMPSSTIDPIVMGSRFVMDVQTVISRQKDPFAFGVITVGSFQAGSASNIIPDDATLGLTLRSFTPQVREQLVEGVKRTALSVAAMSLAPEPEIQHSKGAASIINDDELAAEVAETLRKIGNDDIVLVPGSEPGGSASEDYSEFVSASGMRSVYFGIGGYLPSVIADYKKRGVAVPVNHSPYFLPHAETAIPTAIRTLAVAAISVLGKPH